MKPNSLAILLTILAEYAEKDIVAWDEVQELIPKLIDETKFK